MQVTLLAHTPEPERVIAAAARLCYSPSSAAELKERMTGDEVDGLLGIILQSGHLSTCEHASFTFGIDGISRACSHQLVRHRLASYSQQSQRYVRFNEPEIVVPPGIAADKELEESFRERSLQAFGYYQELLDAGVEPEDARYLLPQAVATKIVVTMNARELLHYFTLRTCERAQWEIRGLAEEMLKLVLPLARTVFKKSGPACIRGRCPEGKFYCGCPRRMGEDGLIVIPEEQWVYRGAGKES